MKALFALFIFLSIFLVACTSEPLTTITQTISEGDYDSGKIANTTFVVQYADGKKVNGTYEHLYSNVLDEREACRGEFYYNSTTDTCWEITCNDCFRTAVRLPGQEATQWNIVCETKQKQETCEFGPLSRAELEQEILQLAEKGNISSQEEQSLAIAQAEEGCLDHICYIAGDLNLFSGSVGGRETISWQIQNE